jgi:hypothetical protein
MGKSSQPLLVTVSAKNVVVTRVGRGKEGFPLRGNKVRWADSIEPDEA